MWSIGLVCAAEEGKQTLMERQSLNHPHSHSSIHHWNGMEFTFYILNDDAGHSQFDIDSKIFVYIISRWEFFTKWWKIYYINLEYQSKLFTIIKNIEN